MRDALTLFLEASASRGAWEAALIAWLTAAGPTGTICPTAAHTLLLTRMLAQAGQWQQATRIVNASRSGAAGSMDGRYLSASRVAMVAAADAGCWAQACQHIQEAQKCLGGDNGSEANLQAELDLVADAFESSVISRMPDSQRESWLRAVNRIRCDETSANQNNNILTGQQQQQQQQMSGITPITNNEELLHIKYKPKERHSWLRALQILTTMPHPNAVSVNIVIEVLSRQGRQREALRVLTVFMPLRDIYPTTVTVKTAAEAANTMRSLELCKALLNTPALCRQITARAAVPLVLTLQRLGEWKRCLEWWNTLPHTTSRACKSNDNNTDSLEGLRCHLKLSSYVAVCVARNSSCWEEALAVMREATPYDPPLAVLYALRAMRVAGRWEAAVCLFHRSRDHWEPSPVALQVREVMTEQNAESWIPRTVLHSLRTSVGKRNEHHKIN